MRRRGARGAAAGVLVVAALVSAAAASAPVSPTAEPEPPDVAALVSPADDTTAESVTPMLSVTATDSDSDAVEVTFEARATDATVASDPEAAPFTIVVVPDTQHYSDGRGALLEAQLRWIRDSRTELGTAFVVQVGDLVEHWADAEQWRTVSRAFEILDDAGVPYTVLPGNHDLVSAQDVGPFNARFPPSRFADASWSPTTTRYGGHLGQHRFGTDDIDRGNADSYALFTAGGRDFLVLNLEWEAPRYALDWAGRVLAAHPERTVILATHSFLTVEGERRRVPQRPDGTSQSQLWHDFVAAHCQIRLVVAGHEHDGQAGEAARTDDNACGQPVHQILSDYQARANGGDGWLRYYTFDPGSSTMRATTYSPTLGLHETDADSSFTVPFDLATSQPAPFARVASQTAPPGEPVTAPLTGLDPDTEYEWRAVVDDGTFRSVSPSWTLRTPPAAP